MKCKKVQKKLLLFWDNELSSRWTMKIKNHLDRCSECSEHFARLSKIWEFTGDFEQIEPSHYLWNRLSLKTSEYEKNRNIFSDFVEIIGRYAVPISATLIFLIGIVTGIYLGSFSTYQAPDSSTQETALTPNEQFVKSSYLDAFDDLPPESIGGIYIALESGKE